MGVTLGGVIERGLHDRLNAILGERTYRAIAEATGCNAETVRRYLRGQSPSVDFLGAVCRAYDVNAHWLLTGVGVRRQSEARAHSLREAGPAELLAAVSESLERLIERVDRIERYVQTLETIARARRMSPNGGGGSPDAEPPAMKESHDRHGRSVSTTARAERIAAAVPERSPEAVD